MNSTRLSGNLKFTFNISKQLLYIIKPPTAHFHGTALNPDTACVKFAKHRRFLSLVHASKYQKMTVRGSKYASQLKSTTNSTTYAQYDLKPVIEW